MRLDDVRLNNDTTTTTTTTTVLFKTSLVHRNLIVPLTSFEFSTEKKIDDFSPDQTHFIATLTTFML
jgi:hypothetical protein